MRITSRKGDYGPWVLDIESGDLYGHIIAGHLDSGLGYIVPACQVLDDMEKYIGKKPTLAQNLSTALSSTQHFLRFYHAMEINPLMISQPMVSSPHNRPESHHEEIGNIYKCSWDGCDKAYGAVNQLNAHVVSSLHRPKRSAKEFHAVNDASMTSPIFSFQQTSAVIPSECIMQTSLQQEEKTDSMSDKEHLGGDESAEVKPSLKASRDKPNEDGSENKSSGWYKLELNSIADVSLVYADQGRLDEAAETYRRSLRRFGRLPNLVYAIAYGWGSRSSLLFASRNRRDKAAEVQGYPQPI